MMGGRSGYGGGYGGGGFGGYDSGDYVRWFRRRRFRRRRRIQRLVDLWRTRNNFRTNSCRNSRKPTAERLVSVVLYGSAAVPGAKDRLSDFNILCVLTEVTPEELRAAEPVFRWWREMKNPSPLLLELDELRTSTDCFPIEFHDIKERHCILVR